MDCALYRFHHPCHTNSGQKNICHQNVQTPLIPPTGKLQVIPNEKKLKNLNITETDVEAAGLNIGVGL